MALFLLNTYEGTEDLTLDEVKFLEIGDIIRNIAQ